MQTLQQLLNSLPTRYHEASPRARVLTGICGLLVLFSLFSLAFQNSGTDMVALPGTNFQSATEIKNVTQQFSAADLHDWQISKEQILVPANQQNQYLNLLAGNQDVHKFNSNVDTALNNGSILDTPALREMRLRNAREKDLARIIMQIPGIEEAQINIDDHQQRGLSGRKEMTALAAIKATPNSEVTLETSEAIREVIAARFAGLERKNVVVIDLNTGHTFGASDSNYHASNLDIALRNYERWWRGRIANLLIDIPNTRIEVGLYPVKPVHSADQATVNAVNATVSVGIPDSYIQRIANNRKITSQPQRQAIAQEVKQNVTELVQGIIPAVPHTTLENFTVHVATILDIPSNTESASPAGLSGFLGHAWREIIMTTLVLSFMGALIWRNRRKQVAPVEQQRQQTDRPVPHLPPTPQTPAGEDTIILSPGSHAERPPVIISNSKETSAEPSLENELNALVEEAPADAANILRKWISSTSR